MSAETTPSNAEGSGSSRWGERADVARGADYDARWRRLEANGKSVHGEADFVCRFEPARVLDAGCGTGRVAIELDRRGIDVVGVDLDPGMLDHARDKAPEIEWHQADLGAVDLGTGASALFDVVVMAGNVMVFVQPGTEADVVANMSRHLAPGGHLIAGFRLDHDYSIEDYERDCSRSGLEIVERLATWDGIPFDDGDHSYAVSVHRRPPEPPGRTER